MKTKTDYRKVKMSGLMLLAVLILAPVADGAEWSAKMAVIDGLLLRSPLPLYRQLTALNQLLESL